MLPRRPNELNSAYASPTVVDVVSVVVTLVVVIVVARCPEETNGGRFRFWLNEYIEFKWSFYVRLNRQAGTSAARREKWRANENRETTREREN